MHVNNVPKNIKQKKLQFFFTNHVFEGLFFDHRAPFVNEAILIRGYQGTSKPHITQLTKIQKNVQFRRLKSTF